MAVLLSYCLLVLFAIPTIFLFVEVAVAVLFRGRNLAQNGYYFRNLQEGMTIAVLIPAHNEEEVLAATLDNIKQQLQDHDRIVVVADNCIDETAIIARSRNAEVIERHDNQKRGKGYALDCGIRFLKCTPPDVLVIMDADVQVAPGTIATISRLAFHTNRPVQARYLLTLPHQADNKALISAFAFLFKNSIRPAGLAYLGGGCLLTGTGMAFAWRVIADAELASDNIVEDMQLGIDLAIAGATPISCQAALVTSNMAPTENAARVQRIRWEHGHFTTLVTQAGRLFREAFKQRRPGLALLGLEVAVPPLASLAMLLGVFFLLSLIFSFFGVIPASLSFWFAFLNVLLILSMLTTWFNWGREILDWRQLLTIPLYIIWKIPIYFGLLIRRERAWTKTPRK